MTSSVAQSFRRPSDGAGTESLQEYLTAASAIDKIMAGKAQRAQYLAERAGSVLDIGCGTGDALALFASSPRCARIVGVDLNPELLAMAARTAEDPRIELVEADAADLPFDHAVFGAALVERMLQHVADPAAVVAEAVRVVEPGGTVLLVEPDWSTLGMSSGDPDVTAAVLDAVRAEIRHPGVGRDLRPILVEAGAVDVVVDGEVHETADLGTARLLALLDDGIAAVRAAALFPDRDVDRWEQQLGSDAAAGRFSASLVLFVARGTVAGR